MISWLFVLFCFVPFSFSIFRIFDCSINLKHAFKWWWILLELRCFFIKTLTHYKTDLKHAVTMPSLQGQCVTWIHFYWTTLKRFELHSLKKVLFHVAKTWYYLECVLKGALSTLRSETIFGNWKPFKMMKNAFYFTSKVVFVLKIFKFLFDFLVMYWNGLINKTRLIWNFMTSQPRWQAIVIHILPNILRVKGNQAMIFGQLIECNMRQTFLAK